MTTTTTTTTSGATDSTVCEKAQAFADGELPNEQVPEFQRHLPGCRGCQEHLEDAMMLDALASTAGPAAAGAARQSPAMDIQRADARDPVPAVRAGPRAQVVPIDSRRRSGRTRTVFWSGAALAAAAAAVVIAVVGGGQGGRNDDAFASLSAVEARPLAARLAYAPADRHRPLRVTRGAGDTAALPFAAVAKLERDGAWQGVAAAYLLTGDPARAAASLDRAPPALSIDNDRAVLAMQQGRWADALGALQTIVAAAPDHPQANFNLGLVLEQMGRPSDSAAAFEKVASLGEPGWAAEAAVRARDLRSQPAPARE